MSLGLNKTKHRILSVKSTQKITKAMEMVATVKLKKFKDAMDQNSYFASEIEKQMADLFAHDEQAGTHYGKLNPNARGNLYIVITSNLGLCAGYNNALFKYVDTLITPNDTIAPIGSKGLAHFQHDEKYQRLTTSYAELNLSTEAAAIEKMAQQIKDQFNDGRYQKIILVYTKYINSLNFLPTTYQMLPVALTYTPDPEEAYCPPIYEPSARQMIHSLMPYYLASVFYSKLVEAELSEQASRRTAMDSANDNADELLDKLTVEYNKARQNAITQQITEVVSGANAQQ
ncbi:MAG: ATP synthase gamma chain, sodium ion specific [Tenericutes bacterium ADurb.BinA155]|jgi:F-type H+-transporting ATPase subunit gamma|nr:MAG: ATP synthase gamma chain, sodium ion specific [Tenericutes bacterium ADurb.BinA155]